MDPIKSTQRIVLVFGVFAWGVAWIVSAFLNFKFGFTVGGGGVSAIAFALVYLALDISKGAVQGVVAKQEEVFGMPKPVVRFYLAMTIFISFFIASSFNMQTRHLGVAKNQFEISKVSSQQSFIDELNHEKSGLGNPRSTEIINLEISEMKRHPRWGQKYSNGCTDDTAYRTRQFCAQYRALLKEKAKRSRLDSINNQLEVRADKISKTGFVPESDPLTLFIAKSFTKPGDSVSDTRNFIFFLLSVMTSGLIEIWSGLGLTWLIFVAQTGRYVPGFSSSAPSFSGDGGAHDDDFKPGKVSRRHAVSNDNATGAHSLIDDFYTSETSKVTNVDDEDNPEKSTTLFSDMYKAYSEFAKSRGQAPIGKAAFSEYSKNAKYWRSHKQGGFAYCVGCVLKKRK